MSALGSGAIACNEFRGRRRLLQFDPRGATLLGWNQLALLALVVIYSACMLQSGLTGPSPLAAELQSQPELTDALGSLEEFEGAYRLLVVAVYGTVILLSCVFQGLNAVYYFSRRKHILAYLRDTADWVLQVQQLTASS